MHSRVMNFFPLAALVNNAVVKQLFARGTEVLGSSEAERSFDMSFIVPDFLCHSSSFLHNFKIT